MTPQDVIAMVAKHYRLTPELLTGKDQRRHVTQPRQEAMFVIRQADPRFSLARIGEAFGGRDHSTVSNAIEVTGIRMQRDPKLTGRVAGFIVEAMGVAAE